MSTTNKGLLSLPQEIVLLIIDQLASFPPDNSESYSGDEYELLNLAQVNRFFYNAATSRFWAGSTWFVALRSEDASVPYDTEEERDRMRERTPRVQLHYKYGPPTMPFHLYPRIQRLHTGWLYLMLNECKHMVDKHGTNLKEAAAKAHSRLRDTTHHDRQPQNLEQLGPSFTTDLILSLLSSVKYLSLTMDTWAKWQDSNVFGISYCDRRENPYTDLLSTSWDWFLDMMPSLESVRITRRHPGSPVLLCISTDDIPIRIRTVPADDLWDCLCKYDEMTQELINVKLAARKGLHFVKTTTNG